MKNKFLSFDGRTKIFSDLEIPDRYRHINELEGRTSIIPQGSGLSYVAASFGLNVTSINMRRFNRILALDIDNKSITVEAGITIGELLPVLFSRGVTLAVMPGHPQITIGGCVAANIHGKSQYRDGSFGNIIKSLQLFNPKTGMISASSQINSDLFELTIGGYGLTGIIMNVELSIEILNTSKKIELQHIKVKNLESTLDLMNELRDESELLYSWHNFMALGSNFGQGLITSGKYIDSKSAILAINFNEIDGLIKFPFNAYSFTTCNILNYVYPKLCRFRNPRVASLSEGMFPLESKKTYFRLYGSKGLIEHQVLIPFDGWKFYISELKRLVSDFHPIIPLASLKIFNGQGKYLRFDGSGVSLTLDLVPSITSENFLREIDALDSDIGAKVNIIKDSRISKSTLLKQYPEFDQFAEKISEWGAGKIFSSNLSQRLCL